MRPSEAKPKGSKGQTVKGTMPALRDLFREKEETRNPQGDCIITVTAAERNQAAAAVLLARANKGRHFLLSLQKHQAMGLARASERPASVRCNNRHLVLPRHGIYTPCTSNTMVTQGSPDGTTTSLLLMVVDTRPIHLQHPTTKGANPFWVFLGSLGI
jgi:hypothetical protein